VSIKPGIYFQLCETTYHTDPALGSTDIRRLLRSPPDYYWNSWMNPNRPAIDPDTPARARGKAMHKIVLEGEEAFSRLYVRRPDDVEGASSTDKGAITRAAKKNLAAGQTLLGCADYDRVRIAGAMISKHPDLGDAFSNGQSEVSVFWERGGVMRKCRFDYLKPRGIGDLKSITNTKGIEFKAACRNAIANYRYDIQAAHYLEGRTFLPQLVTDGLIYGDHDAEWIRTVAAAPEFAFVFVFFQADDAPITWSCVLSPKNPIIPYARQKIDEAVESYVDFKNRFGTDMWLMTEPMAELSMDEMPGFYGRQ
jgi:hypothetical protein